MQGIIYTSPRWNKLSIGRKQRVKKCLHSSLQNQIHFTAVMVIKWGLPQSSFTSYRKLVGHQSPSGAGSTHCRGTEDSRLPRPETRWHRAIQSNTTGAKGKHAGRELRGKASTAPAYGCSLASWTFGQRRSLANLIPTFEVQCRVCPEGEGQHCPRCSKASERHRLGCGLQQSMAMIWESLCALYQPDLV